MNGIRHILVAAYHPKSSGLADKIVKDWLKMSEGTVEGQIAQFRIESHHRVSIGSEFGSESGK